MVKVSSHKDLQVLQIRREAEARVNGRGYTGPPSTRAHEPEGPRAELQMEAEFEPDMFPDLPKVARTFSRGVLPSQEIQTLLERDAIHVMEPCGLAQIQPASFDLRLGAFALQVRASFLPGRDRTVIEASQSLVLDRIDLRDGAILEKGSVYIVPLLEELRLPDELSAKANPKSTTGRLDVFARLTTDYSEQFDRVRRGYRGPLFLEVAPKTFSIRVRTGSRLNQLRFLKGVPPLSDISRKAEESESLVFDEFGEPMRATVNQGLWFSVDLRGGGEGDIVGWKARTDAPAVDVEKVDHYEPLDFWEPVLSSKQSPLVLDPADFYILGSRERVRIPPSYAAEMVPYDPAMGEFRVHYAGFFDPGFGYGDGEVTGTRAILEVRSHDVPFALHHGQHVGRLVYERLVSVPDRLYGRDVPSSYQHQTLGLGKQFRDPARNGQTGWFSDFDGPAVLRRG